MEEDLLVTPVENYTTLLERTLRFLHKHKDREVSKGELQSQMLQHMYDYKHTQIALDMVAQEPNIGVYRKGTLTVYKWHDMKKTEYQKRKEDITWFDGY